MLPAGAGAVGDGEQWRAGAARVAWAWPAADPPEASAGGSAPVAALAALELARQSVSPRGLPPDSRRPDRQALCLAASGAGQWPLVARCRIAARAQSDSSALGQRRAC